MGKRGDDVNVVHVIIVMHHAYVYMNESVVLSYITYSHIQSVEFTVRRKIEIGYEPIESC